MTQPQQLKALLTDSAARQKAQRDAMRATSEQIAEERRAESESVQPQGNAQ